MGINYIDKDGYTIFVHYGLSEGKQWGSFKQRNRWSLRRVKSPMMPMVSSKEQAQMNLDAWAKKRGLPVWERE